MKKKVPQDILTRLDSSSENIKKLTQRYLATGKVDGRDLDEQYGLFSGAIISFCYALLIS